MMRIRSACGLAGPAGGHWSRVIGQESSVNGPGLMERVLTTEFTERTELAKLAWTMKRGLSADSADETDFKSQISNLKWEDRDPPQIKLIQLQ